MTLTMGDIAKKALIDAFGDDYALPRREIAERLRNKAPDFPWDLLIKKHNGQMGAATYNFVRTMDDPISRKWCDTAESLNIAVAIVRLAREAETH